MYQFLLRCFRLLGLSVLAVLEACTPAAGSASPVLQRDEIYAVQADGDRIIARAVTREATCPKIQWDDNEPVSMTLRAGPAVIPVRGDSVQRDIKEARFDASVCETQWPAGARRARVEGRDLPPVSREIRRIVLIADTGCRMKASDQAFQECNDPAKWPFAKVAQQAAALKPDLVVHLGDIHYRESPCPAQRPGCHGSPWGYGYDAWRADFFEPAAPLLAAAPWVFVRGNHESCARAGQGWFRFIDIQPWTEARSCNDAASDNDANYSNPYAVRISDTTQFIVFDSSKTSGNPLSPQDVTYQKYSSQVKQVNELTQEGVSSLFMSHHPLLAYAPTDNAARVKVGGNGGLVSVFSAQFPRRLFPQNVDMVLHGHIHLFEVLGFQSDHPVSLILGNSGSAMEGLAPVQVTPATPPYPGAIVEDYASSSEYGFATLDRAGPAASSNWLLTEYNVDGQPLLRCNLDQNKSRCTPAH